MKKNIILTPNAGASLLVEANALPEYLQRAGLRLAALILRPTAQDPIPSAVPAARTLLAFSTELVTLLAQELERLWLARLLPGVAQPFAVDQGRRLYLALADDSRSVMVDLSALAFSLLQTDPLPEHPISARQLQALVLADPTAHSSHTASLADQTLPQVKTLPPRLVRHWRPRLQAWLDDPGVLSLPPAEWEQA